MCGIAGYVAAAAGTAPLAAMLRVLEHRGPDDTGTWTRDGAALGMTRLAIIDLVTGGQPMTTADGGGALVFNGEIYNFRDLRATLHAGGARFTTTSDTEVLLRAWERDGEACVEGLRGMFAFAVWDARRRRLFIARDRLGKKPLYYWQGAGTFVFASEIKALLAHPAVPRELDWAALHHYMAFGYTPGDRSIFAGIHKLPAGHTATLEGGVLTLRRYWTLPPGGAAAPASAAERAPRVRAELRDAVRVRLESDVPLGVFLSGGIDSSAIVACMREITSGRIATFTIGMGTSGRGADDSHDERPYARMVAERFGTEHHEEIVEPKIADLAAALVRHFDEPFADSSALPTFAVAQAASRHLKVALSGIGGDEAFGGYPRYLGVRLSGAYGRVPEMLRAVPDAAARAVLRDSAASRNLGDWWRRFSAGAGVPMPERYIGWTRFFGGTDLAALATPALQARWAADVEAPARQAWQSRAPGDAVDGAMRIDLATYLPDDLLTMADRMSMAHSLEVRAPFCDHRVIEAALALPSSAKVSGLRLKAVLKDAFADVLPAAIRRRRKQGFMIPLNRWLRDDLRELVDTVLAPEQVRARGLFRPEAVARLRSEHAAGARTHGDRLWTLVMLELWMREYLDGRTPWRLDAAPAAVGPSLSRPAAEPSPRILLVLVAGIGDFVLATPALRALRRRWPGARLTLLTSPHVEALARSCADVDEVLTFDLGAARTGWPRAWRLGRETAAALRARGFDTAVNLYGVRTLTGALRMWMLLRSVGARRTVGRWSGGRGWFFDVRVPDVDHEVDAQLAVAAALGAEAAGDRPELAIADAARTAAAAALRDAGLAPDAPYIVLNVGSRRPEARLPVTRAVELVRALRRVCDVPVVLPGSRDEGALIAAICAAAPGRVIDLAGKVDVLGLTALLQGARAVVTTDSGPMHMATAVGVPVIVLFGPARPAETGPRGRPGQTLVLQGRTHPSSPTRWHEDLPIAEAVKAVVAHLGERSAAR
jgi:asparagine synthase (glutamine-hydrolysing)